MNHIWAIEIFSRGEWRLLSYSATIGGNTRAAMRLQVEHLRSGILAFKKLRIVKYIREGK